MKKLLIGALSLLIFTAGNTFANDAKVNLVSISNLVEQVVAAQILTDVYKKAGLEIDIEPMPGQRAHSLATDGTKDGETARIFSYGEKNPTVVRVPTPYSSLETTAFAKKSANISISSQEDLKKYKVVIVRGVQHTKDMTEGHENVHVINDAEQMMKFLEGGRADIALNNTISAKVDLQKLKIADIVPVGTLQTLDLFNYIHENRKDIVSKVDATIQEMKESGELKTLREKYEREYLDSIK
ncbi:MAG: polar amino acid transport system substrate-binding protein [Desulforhopalus sp.]|jgi:polar amino acid transport system substrate-binding protein